MRLYKWTDADGYTRRGEYNEVKWRERVMVEIPESERGWKLCQAGLLHAYVNPLLAVMMDPIFGGYSLYKDYRDGRWRVGILWECEGEPVVFASDKVGCHRLTMSHCVDVPIVTPEQRIRFAVLAALEVCTDNQLKAWAVKWLDGTDRSRAAVDAVIIAANRVLDRVAACAACATSTIGDVSCTSARAAHYAAMEKPTIDLVALAEQALEEDSHD